MDGRSKIRHLLQAQMAAFLLLCQRPASHLLLVWVSWQGRCVSMNPVPSSTAAEPDTPFQQETVTCKMLTAPQTQRLSNPEATVDLTQNYIRGRKGALNFKVSASRLLPLMLASHLRLKHR